MQAALVTRISALFRGRRDRRIYRGMLRRHCSALAVRSWHRYLAKKAVEVEVDYLQKIKFLQAFWRFRYRLLNMAATVIQKTYKGRRVQREYVQI